MDKGKGKQVALDGFLREDGSKPWLANLNEAQKEGVTWQSTGGLQILAGPGSGKTRVLTCRVAYLVKECGLKPEELIVVTFTNKAANEMKHRLKTLLGEPMVNRILMGTFHSVAVRFLRKYGKHVDLPNNFLIADSGDSQSILKPIVAQHNEALNAEGTRGGSSSSSDGSIKIKDAQSTISKTKAKGMSPERYMAEVENEQNRSPYKIAMAGIYQDYQNALRASNTVDFDDLLVFCERLLAVHPSAVSGIQQVLVDEFQDTNTIQYNIVKLMARARRSLTIVGDPDQSIYSWRSAEVENLHFMLDDFKGTHQVWLEENYRSTSSILEAALAVVSQDKERIQKSLRTSHPVGPPVVLRKLQTAQDEASYIAYEIKKAIAYSGNMLDYNDFAILLRYNALSRAIEAGLQAASIPSRMIGGHKFFERAEVKDILCYLQLAENPSYSPAFVRIVNVPKRGIGDKSVKDIQQAAKDKKTSCFDIVTRALKGSSVGNVKPAQRAALKPFVAVITKVRAMAAQGEPVSALIDYVVDKISYKDHLERTYGVDYAARVENIHELKNYAEQIAQSNAINLTEISEVGAIEKKPSISRASSNGDGRSASTPFDLDSDNDSAEDSKASAEIDVADLAEDNALRTFLAASMLSTDNETQEAKDDKLQAKVTISTCHAAKGLEWPVVFLPASETGVYPAFQKSDNAEVAEERRLYYVAMTRGQAMLHMTHVAKRMDRGQTTEKDLTEFLRPLAKDSSMALVQEIPSLTSEMRACVAAVLGKTAIDEVATQAAIQAFTSSTPAPVYETEESRFTSGFSGRHPQLNYSEHTSPGLLWRQNSYAGDQAKRYAASLPNTGVNRFAGAFSMAPRATVDINAVGGFSRASSIAASTQAPGFTSGLATRPAVNTFATESGMPPFPPSSATLPPTAASAPASSATSSVRSAFVTSRSGQASFSVNRPFKAPSMVKKAMPPLNGASHVSTVETRLTQQQKGIILEPLPPKEPHRAPFSLSPSKQDHAFSDLMAMAKEEEDYDMAPRRPAPIASAGAKKRGSSASVVGGSASAKRSRP